MTWGLGVIFVVERRGECPSFVGPNVRGGPAALRSLGYPLITALFNIIFTGLDLSTYSLHVFDEEASFSENEFDFVDRFIEVGYKIPQALIKDATFLRWIIFLHCIRPFMGLYIFLTFNLKWEIWPAKNFVSLRIIDHHTFIRLVPFVCKYYIIQNGLL